MAKKTQPKAATTLSQEEKAVAAKAPGRVAVERERGQFSVLLAGNPNYFGNLEGSPFKAVKPLQLNKKYEEVTCVGFNLNLNTLEATIQIKLPVGYGGNLCQAGSTEYVRFFIDYGTGWQDAGMVSFNVHDIPNSNDCAKQPTKPLSYVLTQEIDPLQKFCFTAVLPKVRAILSWQIQPPAGNANANWLPVWGNVLDRHIQIKPRPWNFVDLVDVLGASVKQKLTLPTELEEVKLQPIPLPDPPPVELAELAELYRGQATRQEAKSAAITSVEPHRFGLEQLHAAISAGALDQPALSAKISEWQALGLNWQAAVSALQQTNGNTTYEQLECLGLDYNREWLTATFIIKKPTGYSGDLCRRGSQEYVAFWADWDNTCEWTYLGTIPINVHDIATIPADGLHYTAILGVNLNPFRRACTQPKIGRVRAVLSWNVPPSAVDPNAIPYWGNRLDAHVQIKPGRAVGELEPEIAIIGGISVSQINIFGNGMTTPNAVFALYGGFADPNVPTRSCPFGGRIHVQAYAPPILSALGYKYRVLARKVGTFIELPVTTPFQIADGFNPPVMRVPNQMTGFIEYVNPTLNLFNMLAWWEPTGDDLWEIRLEMVTAMNVFVGTTVWHRVQLDNTKPEAAVSIDGGDCEEFNPGVILTGRFVARDVVGFSDHFGVYTLDTLPDSVSPPDPTPASGTTQTAATPGDAWSLNTTGMTPCGYVILLQVWDRAIVGSLPGSHNYNKDDVGFCLLT
jgi:hypothetical protein